MNGILIFIALLYIASFILMIAMIVKFFEMARDVRSIKNTLLSKDSPVYHPTTNTPLHQDLDEFLRSKTLPLTAENIIESLHQAISRNLARLNGKSTFAESFFNPIKANIEKDIEEARRLLSEIDNESALPANIASFANVIGEYKRYIGVDQIEVYPG